MVHKRHKSQEIGRLGEDLACSFLEKCGFKILSRNYSRPWGELDIVAKKGDLVHFVEVKTVSRETLTDNDYEPEDNLHPWKRKRLRRIIQTYLVDFDEIEDWQVDAISVYLNQAGDLLKVDWLEDIIL